MAIDEPAEFGAFRPRPPTVRAVTEDEWNGPISVGRALELLNRATRVASPGWRRKFRLSSRFCSRRRNPRRNGQARNPKLKGEIPASVGTVAGRRWNPRFEETPSY